jgi:hypothetical protein
MLALKLKTGVWTTLTLIGTSAYFHGLAHGAELATGMNVLCGIISDRLCFTSLGIIIAMRFLMKRPEFSQRLGETLRYWAAISCFLPSCDSLINDFPASNPHLGSYGRFE